MKLTDVRTSEEAGDVFVLFAKPLQYDREDSMSSSKTSVGANVRDVGCTVA